MSNDNIYQFSKKKDCCEIDITEISLDENKNKNIICISPSEELNEEATFYSTNNYALVMFGQDGFTIEWNLDLCDENNKTELKLFLQKAIKDVSI